MILTLCSRQACMVFPHHYQPLSHHSLSLSPFSIAYYTYQPLPCSSYIHPSTRSSRQRAVQSVCLYAPPFRAQPLFPPLPSTHISQGTIDSTALPGATIAPSSRTAPRASPTGTLPHVDPHPSRLLRQTAPVGGRLPSPCPLHHRRWSSPAVYCASQSLWSIPWLTLGERA